MNFEKKKIPGLRCDEMVLSMLCFDTAFLMINCEIIARNVAWWDLLEHLCNLKFLFLSDHRYAPHLMLWKMENLSP